MDRTSSREVEIDLEKIFKMRVNNVECDLFCVRGFY